VRSMIQSGVLHSCWYREFNRLAPSLLKPCYSNTIRRLAAIPFFEHRAHCLAAAQRSTLGDCVFSVAASLSRNCLPYWYVRTAFSVTDHFPTETKDHGCGLGLETCQRLVSVSPITSRAQDQFSAILCRPQYAVWTGFRRCKPML